MPLTVSRSGLSICDEGSFKDRSKGVHTPPLQPPGSEKTRPGGLLLRTLRGWATYRQVWQRFTAFLLGVVSHTMNSGPQDPLVSNRCGRGARRVLGSRSRWLGLLSVSRLLSDRSNP